MKQLAINLLCWALGQVGYWALEWRERLEPAEEIKVGGTSSDD